ncbi:MAG: hypothetical protein IJ693_05310 [Bacteroidaceae bacterium]|nr:hypothetical protein [Bacteroidaceae bacterium]
MRELSPQAVEALKEIKKTWDKLQKEPYGRFLPNGMSLPPSSGNYLYNVDKLEKQIGLLCDETSNAFQTVLNDFCHTVDKECAYVRNYRDDSRKSREKNNAVLSDLMRNANNQIALDLFPVLKLTHNL